MKLWTLALIASLCITPGPVAAESPVWLSFGGGAAGHPGRGMGGARLGMHWSEGKSVWTVSLAGYEEANFFIIRSPRESVVELGALYGRRWGGRVGFVSLNAGLALVSGTHRGQLIGRSGWMFDVHEKYEARHFTTVGVPLDVQFALVPSKTIGFALSGFYDLNPRYSFGGGLLSLLIGELR